MSGDPRTRVEALREELGKSICINDSEAGVVSWALAELSRVLDDDHDTPTADAVPDVPPDPPAADREAIARVLIAHRLVAGHKDIWTMCVCGVEVDNSAEALSAHRADAMFADSVLVDAADVRARALEDARDAWQQGQWADAPRRPDRAQERIANAQFVTDWLTERAVSERAGTT